MYVAALSIGAAPAQAFSSRAWVSVAKGVDQSGCGQAISPCRTLQYALDNVVAAGGEINVLDPGGYGTLLIGKSVTIANDGVGLASIVQSAAGQDAIKIVAGDTDKIVLRGLSISGGGTGRYGVSISYAGAVFIENCSIGHFASNGVYAFPPANGRAPSPTMSISIVDSTISFNNSFGLDAGASAGTVLKVFIDRSRFDSNTYGANVQAFDPTSKMHATVVDSSFTNNSSTGFKVVGGYPAASATAFATLNRTTVSNNHIGITTLNFSVVRLERSMIVDNDQANGDSTSAYWETFGDNAIRGNTLDFSATHLTSVPLR